MFSDEHLIINLIESNKNVHIQSKKIRIVKRMLIEFTFDLQSNENWIHILFMSYAGRRWN